VSTTGSLFYTFVGFHHKILSSFVRKQGTFSKNSGDLTQLLKSVNLQSLDVLVSFDVVNLFTKIPIDEALQVIRNKLHNDDMLVERSVLQVEAFIELLRVCLRTTYFQVDDKFFLQKDGMDMGSSLSPIVSVTMESSEKLALGSTEYKPSLWLRCVGNILVVWPHGSQRLRNFLKHLRPSIQFTMEIK
jgi:hypothetical protein